MSPSGTVCYNTGGMGVEQVKVCPFCKHENRANATQCAKCGVSFVSEVTTTLPVPGQIADEVREDLEPIRITRQRERR